MKFLCDRGRLEGALSPILPAIPTKDAAKPALKSLYLAAEEDALILRGSNMELSVEIRLDEVKVEKPGACLVPARPFYSLVHEVPDPTVRIEVNKGTLVLPSSSGKFELVTGPADDYPELDFGRSGGVLDVPVELLQRHYQSTEFACAREATRYAMNGILLSFGTGKLTTVATDGRRLAMTTSPLESDAPKGDELQALLPHRSLGAAVKAIAALSNESVSVRFGDAVSFTVPNGTISVQRINGAFPDFNTVIPRDCSNVVELSRPLLEANLRRSAVMTEDINPAVKISFEGSQARFESEATGVGSAETVMDVDLAGKGGHIVFNPHFITDVMRVTQGDLIKFEFDDANLPGKFVLGEDFTYVIMPITGV